MFRDELFVLRNACSAIGSLATIVARGPQPEPAPGDTPLAIILHRFGRSDGELVERLKSLGKNLTRRAATIDHAREWEMHLSDEMERETSGWLCEAANVAGELLRLRSRLPNGVVVSDSCSHSC